MKFVESGNRCGKTVILVHGGGLSWWSLKGAAEKLSYTYHVVTPVIDGHGEDGGTTFVSIEDSAEKLIRYIDEELGGRAFLLGGLSLGAQITVEVLSRRPDIAEYAVVESGLVIPIRGTRAVIAPSFGLFYGLVSKRWFSKLQAKSLCVPPAMFELYNEDSRKMSKQTLINISLSNGGYMLKSGIGRTSARVLIIVGSKELGIMKRSAEKLHEAIPASRLYIAEGMKHGEISLVHTEQYASLLKSFVEE